MELRHLRYFVAVAEELHFRKAAERLHIAQPAVSEQIRKLEQELGVKLFERTQRNVTLTSAGTALLEEARVVLRHADVAQRAARSAGDHVRTRLRVGYLPDCLPANVPRALRRLAASAPSVEVELETGSALRLLSEVRAGRLDAVITSLPAPTQGLRVTPLGEQHAVAALPLMSPHATQPSVDLERLAPGRLIVLPRDVNPAFHNAVVALCHSAGVAPAFIEPPEPRVEHVLLAVAAGAGVALLPDAVTERFACPGVRFVPVRSETPAFRCVAVTRPDTGSLATVALLRALGRTAAPGARTASRPALESAA